MKLLKKVLPAMLCAVLFIAANSGSTFAIYQPKTPDGLKKFSRIR